MSKYNVKINPRAIRELDSIYAYIANEKMAPENARGQVDRIRWKVFSSDDEEFLRKILYNFA